MRNKKALGPVIAISLLVIVVVVAVISFQNWYTNYNSKQFSNIETKDKSSDISIESISNTTIFIKNNFKENYTLKKIVINDNYCIINQNLSLGINNISINYCLSHTGINDISLITEDNIVQKNIYIEDFTITKYDSYTKFIMHCDDSIIDDSYSNHPLTIYDNTHINYSQGRWGNSCYFDGDSDMITIPFHPDFALGSENFTIDFWIYYPGVLTIGDYFLINDGVGFADFLAYGFPGQNTINYYINDGTYVGSQFNNVYLSADTWYHIAFVRVDDSWRVYVDGTLLNSGTYAGSIDTSTSNIVYVGSSTRYTKAYIDEFRVSVGIARWTSNFFPNSEPYK